MHNIKQLKIKQNLGFGLIELMVSVSIVVLVTSIILAKHDKYNSAVLLRSQAYDVALKMREVQLQAVSATGQGGEYRNVMGLHFNTTNTANTYYQVFVDRNGNNFYDPNNVPAEAFGPRINLDRRFEFSSVITLVGGSGGTPTALSVIFERPNFDARFFTAANTEASSNVSGMELGVRLKGTTDNGAGSVRTVEVSRTGQIVVLPVVSQSSN